MMSGEDLLNTNQLIERIEAELGLVYDRNTITAWSRLPDDHPVGPMPVAYQGRQGQANGYRVADVLAWLSRYLEYQDAQSGDSESIKALDYHGARTVEMRERAKQAIMDTGERAGSLGMVAEMEAAAEDLGRRASEALLAIPDRLASALAACDDEVEVHRMLDVDLRRVCDQIASYAEHERDG